MRCVKTLASFTALTFVFAISACRTFVSTSRSDAQSHDASGEGLWLEANGLRLKTEIYKNAHLSPHPTLVIVLHGDLLEANVAPTYHYVFARRAATQIEDVIAVGLVRPGYTDGMGDRSGGSRGIATGDNYTPEIVDAIAQAVDQLKSRFHPSATILVGHSGGAAISADLIARHPNEVAGALLVSCPCDLPAWRKYMVKAIFPRIGPLSLLFLLPVNSLSPTELASAVPGTVRVRMMVGGSDQTAPVRFTQAYADLLKKNGDNVNVTVLPGLPHNILLEPPVLEQLKSLVQEVRNH